MTTQTDTAPLSAEDASHGDDARMIARLARREELEAENARLSARVESLENSRSCAIADHVAADARATQAEAERDKLLRDRVNGYVVEDGVVNYLVIREALSKLSGVPAMADVTMRHIEIIADKLAKAGIALSASQAREAGMREALEPFLAAAAGMAEIDMPDDAAVLRASADWWLRSGEAGKKGRPLTFGDFRKLAALSPAQPAQDADPLVTAYDNGVDHAWGVARPLALAAEGVINWCDLALAHADRFDAHGVRNLSGPAFDVLREAVEGARSAGLLTTETTEGK
ncbi:hypothetical protein [Azospirillum formosense]|uniref:hypothetical protein n=1 Tax=Azospirillum formosense TaxID=861533 RepID=UPI00338E50FF